MENFQPSTPDERWLTEPEAARRMGLSPQTLSARRRRGGDIPPHVTTGDRRHLYREADVEMWLAARTTDPAAAAMASIIEASRTPRDEVATDTAAVALGGFALTLADRHALRAALAKCPASMTALDLAQAACQDDTLVSVTWCGTLTSREVTAAITALGTHAQRRPHAEEEAARSLGTSIIYTAIINGAGSAAYRKAA